VTRYNTNPAARSISPIHLSTACGTQGCILSHRLPGKGWAPLRDKIFQERSQNRALRFGILCRESGWIATWRVHVSELGNLYTKLI
jgi:hypothetical protein